MLSRLSSTSRLPWTTPVTCLRHASSQHKGLNTLVKDILNKEIQNEETLPEPNRYKLSAFNRALTAINNVEYPIKSLSQLYSMKGIGPGISKRIGDVLINTSQNLEPTVQAECEKIRIRDELATLPTIGKLKATRLVEAGCRGIKDMHQEKYLSMLSSKQRSHIQYHKYLAEPVRREEAELVVNFIRGRLPTTWEVSIVGDLRRHVPESNEIQILLVHKDPAHLPMPNKPISEIDPKIRPKPFSHYASHAEKRSSPFHKTAIPVLRDGGLLATELDMGPRTWEGVIRLPENLDVQETGHLWPLHAHNKTGSEKFRKLVLISAPVKSRGAALISWTGDNEYAKSMRIRAHKLGMYLDEVGLWKWHAEGKGLPQDGENYREKGFWQLLQSSTEEEIFEQLDAECLDPERRNFKFISQS